MLYLPPRWAHDGIAQGECQTWSVGFRAPAQGELTRELLLRLADEADQLAPQRLYRDPLQVAVTQPAAVPQGLYEFAEKALRTALREPLALARALGELLTEPKPDVWFEPGKELRTLEGVRLDRRSRMMHDAHHLFLNGESYRAAGRDAMLMRRLANGWMHANSGSDEKVATAALGR
jgi:50S ribosomal protein L16 3-hydroxylase